MKLFVLAVSAAAYSNQKKLFEAVAIQEAADIRMIPGDWHLADDDYAEMSKKPVSTRPKGIDEMNFAETLAAANDNQSKLYESTLAMENDDLLGLSFLNNNNRLTLSEEEESLKPLHIEKGSWYGPKPMSKYSFSDALSVVGDSDENVQLDFIGDELSQPEHEGIFLKVVPQEQISKELYK